MGKASSLRAAFKRYPRALFVMALVGAMTLPQIVTAIADTADNTVYTLTAPCAVFDTRSWDMDGDGNTDAKPASSQEMSFYVANDDVASARTHQFADDPATADAEKNQGGTLGGCGVPETATGVLINLVSVFPEGDGNLKAYGWGDSEFATGGVLVYDNSQTIGIGNMIMLELNTTETAETNGGSTDGGGHIQVFVNGPSTHVRGVVMGWLEADAA